jgi:hypothetical protein
MLYKIRLYGYAGNSLLTIELMRSSDIGQGVHKPSYDCQTIMEFRSYRILQLITCVCVCTGWSKILVLVSSFGTNVPAGNVSLQTGGMIHVHPSFEL